MRLAGTAIICILAAFGAAFLVARAVRHETPARAAGAGPKTTRVAATVPAPPSTATHADAELVAQFTPQRTGLKPKPKPKRPHHKPTPPPVVTPVVPVAPATTPTPVTPTPSYSAPVQSSPAPTQTPAPRKKKSSSGGSGTTTIGG